MNAPCGWTEVLERARTLGCEVTFDMDGRLFIGPPLTAKADPYRDDHRVDDLQQACERLRVYEVHMLLEHARGFFQLSNNPEV